MKQNWHKQKKNYDKLLSWKIQSDKLSVNEICH